MTSPYGEARTGSADPGGSDLGDLVAGIRLPDRGDEAAVTSARAGQQRPLVELAGPGAPGSADGEHLRAALGQADNRAWEADVVARGQANGDPVDVDHTGSWSGATVLDPAKPNAS